MLEKINYEYYKNVFLNYNFHGERNSFEEQLFLKNNFNENKIKNAVDNTYIYFLELIKKMEKNSFIKDNVITYEIKLPLSCDENGIITRAGSSFVFDLLFYLDDKNKDFVISKLLLEKYFGCAFQIDNDYDEKKVFCKEDNCYKLILMPKLIVTGSYSEFLRIFDDLFGIKLERKI